LDDIAVDADLALAKLWQVDDGAQGAANQTLYLLRTAGGVPDRHLAAHAVIGGARQHAILGRHPAAPLALEPRRHPLFEARRTQHVRIPELNETRAFGMFGDGAFDRHAA
jgi:hypothetical protein